MGLNQGQLRTAVMRMSKDSLPLIPEANIAKGNTEDAGLEGKLLLNVIDFLKQISAFLGFWASMT